MMLMLMMMMMMKKKRKKKREMKIREMMWMVNGMTKEK